MSTCSHCPSHSSGRCEATNCAAQLCPPRNPRAYPFLAGTKARYNLGSREVHRVAAEGTQHICPARGSAWAGGRHHTPSRVPQRWDTTSCREAAPLTPHAQPGTPAVGYHQLPRGSSTYTTRPAGYPSGGIPPAVERQLHLHHTPSRVPQRWGTASCSRVAPLTPHAQPGTPAVGYRQLLLGGSTFSPVTQKAGAPALRVHAVLDAVAHIRHLALELRHGELGAINQRVRQVAAGARPRRHVRFCRHRFPATDLNSKANWFGIQ
jgi:hypothetical protein